MDKVRIDLCDVCGEIIVTPKGGIEISSNEHVNICWAGKNSPPGDPFQNAGVHLPLSGRVTLTVCKDCLLSELELMARPPLKGP